MLLVLSNKEKGMQNSREQPLVGEERYVTTLITAAKETKIKPIKSGKFRVCYVSKSLAITGAIKECTLTCEREICV